jgi:hypothetical protein
MKNYVLPLAFILMLGVSSCSKKKETNTIITKIETPKVSKEIHVIGDEETKKSFKWGDVFYHSVIIRKADKEQPTVKDDDGKKYFDNTIELALSGPNGEVFRREFHKSDFTPYIDTHYLKPSKSALMSIVFNKVDGGKALFVATIGSPDEMADEYMFVRIALSKTGEMSMSKIQATE